MVNYILKTSIQIIQNLTAQEQASESVATFFFFKDILYTYI